MQTIWAPWRIKYILSGGKARECFFCQKLQQPDKDQENFVLYRGKDAFALLNIYPYNSGHIMIAPYAHVSTLTDLTQEQISDLFFVTQLCEGVLTQGVRPEGFNIGINLGRASGAGMEEHLHVHIVPRWNGDTNYMTTISNVRVIPEHLEDSYARLAPLFPKAG
jgi:ATP adenylyltransferase